MNEKKEKLERSELIEKLSGMEYCDIADIVIALHKELEEAKKSAELWSKEYSKITAKYRALRGSIESLTVLAE